MFIHLLTDRDVFPDFVGVEFREEDIPKNGIMDLDLTSDDQSELGTTKWCLELEVEDNKIVSQGVAFCSDPQIFLGLLKGDL